MADMATALKGGYADQFKAMLRNPNIPENSLLTRAIHGGAGLVDAYNAWDAPDATTMQGALKYGAMPAKAAVGMGKGMLDVLKGAMDNPEDSMKMLDLASMVAGGGFGAGKMLGGAPKGSIGMNVYQGGPHKYGPEGAAQSLQHMSKGEGARAYGWGRYDAGAKDVGQDYKRTLSGDWSDINRVGDALYDALDPLPNGDVLFKGSKYSKAEFDRVIVPQLDGRDLWGSLPPGLRTATEKKLEGYLYKHDLPDDDIARYLDWDAPLSEQPESVRAGVETLYDDIYDRGYQMSMRELMEGKDPTGKDIYHKVGTYEKLSNPDISRKLAEHGIPGLKYYDGMSRSAGEGTRNYVTWDQDVLNRMKLLERNGESMTDALTGTK